MFLRDLCFLVEEDKQKLYLLLNLNNKGYFDIISEKSKIVSEVKKLISNISI